MTPAPNPERRAWRGWQILAYGLASLVLLAGMAAGALWWWAGSEGSLATALRWLAKSQPLQAEGAKGSLRAGGKVMRLVWQRDGLTIEASDVTLAWQPWSLVHGRLQLDRLGAASLRIDDRRAPSAAPALPPQALGLPLRIALKGFSIGQLQWAGPPEVEVSGISGSYFFTGQQHQLTLAGAQFASGRYQGKATLGAAQPLPLDARFSGTVDAPVPGRASPLPLSFSASALGPLETLAVKAALQVPAGTTSSNAATAPHATVTAILTPWAAQPLPEADAEFRALDIAALWPQGPRTALSGSAFVRPLRPAPGSPGAGSTPTAGTATWSLQTRLNNDSPGPWDAGRLPLQDLQAQGEWRSGVAVVNTLSARIGGGLLTAHGEWAPPSPPASAGAGTNRGWALQSTLQDINPAALHTRLAALPLSGRANARSQGAAIVFDASVRARAASAAGPPVKPSAQRGNVLEQLRLRDLRASGSWNTGQAGGTLALSEFKLRTDDAALSGTLEAQPAARGGKGRITLSAPGLEAQTQGELRAASGAGTLRLQAGDAQLALRWLQRLPGVPAAIQGAVASGRADLKLDWQGGWQDPLLQARLEAPSLDWRSGSGAAVAAASPATATAAESMLKFRGVEATLSGKLSQAHLALQGRMEAEERRFALKLAADGGRIAANPQGAGARAPASGWQAALRQLRLSVEDPALGEGVWRLATRADVALRWTPTPSGGALEAGAGEAELSAPRRSSPSAPTAGAATPSQALVQWTPLRWSAGQLTTAGKVTGLPLAWIELAAGPQMAGAGLSGNLLFDGSWDAVLGDTIRVRAALARSSGDMTVQGETASGSTARVAAGVKEARLSLDSDGEALTLALRWDSERAGTAEGRLTTRLVKNGSNGPGWSWPADAPLRGQFRAQLPRLGVWSVLAPPGWRLRGTLGASVAISGTRAQPQLAGDLLANDLALRSVVDGIEFGNGRLRAHLDGTRMRINQFSLQGSGTNGSGGTLTAQGEAAWIDGKPQVQVEATLQRLRASIRTDRQVTLSGDIQARLEGKLTQLDGKLKIDQALVLLPEEGTPQLGEDVTVRGSSGAAAGQKGPAEANAGKPGVQRSVQNARALKVAVQIDLGPDFRVQGKGIDTRVRGSLALTADSLLRSGGPAVEPRLVGTVNTFGGQYRAYGQRLDVEQGVLRFTGPVDNPALDILAVRPNMTQRVGVQITGTALLPRVRLYAQPELPDAEKLSWLVLGHGAASGGAEAALLQQAALALLGSKGGANPAGLAASLGLDELSFRGSASKADGTTTEGAVTLGKRFSRNFYAAYERSISGALGTLFVFYELSQRFTVRAQAGQQSAVDLIYTFQYD